MVFAPSLIKAVFDNPNAPLESDSTRWSLLVNVFGADRRRKRDYLRVRGDVHTSFTNHILSGPTLSETIDVVVARIQEQVPNLVSFSESPVDQNFWERTAFPIVQADGSAPAVQVSLYALIRNFVGHIGVSVFMGSEFAEINPTALEDLWDLDHGLTYLALGLPRWLPIPSLTKAHIARRRLGDAIDLFHRALDKTAAGDEPDQPWRDVSDASRLMRERSAAWREYGTHPGIKGPCDLGLLWA